MPPPRVLPFPQIPCSETQVRTFRAASLPALFEKYGIGETEVIQIAVSKLNSKHHLVAEPAPWLISGKA